MVTKNTISIKINDQPPYLLREEPRGSYWRVGTLIKVYMYDVFFQVR